MRKYIPITNHCTFAKVMGDNPDLCKEVIERMLGMEINHIEILETEAEITGIVTKSVRLDAYLESNAGAFEIEMQTTDEPNLGLRMRYYQSLIDRRLLPKGESYHALKPLYVIFICLTPPFKNALNVPEFRFEMHCKETPEAKLDTHATYVIFNTSGDMSMTTPGIGRMLHYFKGASNQSQDALIGRLEAAVEKANRDEEWVDAVLTIEQHIKEAEYLATLRGEAQGMAKGMEEGLAKGMAKGMEEGRAEGEAKGKAETEDLFKKVLAAMEASGLTISEVTEALSSHTMEELSEQYLP